ncbi:MAG TPA: LysE family transporter [Bdellovibrionota bacterium]|jgi:L-lysine exporter family protein LysE/ArgO|nr:LysE family transporter [Bdellovibrionota bacterium]
MFRVFAQGFLLQASLILALGAQNLFVLNAGLRRQHPLLVALIASLCDAMLIFVGVLGVASIFVQMPMLKISLGVLGVAFLFYYGLLKLREAKNGVELPQALASTVTIKQTILASLAFSLLNPHALLDTIVLIGGYSSRFALFSERFYFGAGAAVFSALWFLALVLLSTRASRLLSSPRAMRGVCLVSGLILIYLTFKLGAEVLGWIKDVSK